MTYLGLDIGGTHCRHAFLPTTAGSCGSGAGVQPLLHGEAAVVRQLSARLCELGRDQTVRQAVVAMAGAGERSLRDRLAGSLQAAGVPFPVMVAADVLAAAAAALRDGPGVAIWSGTGSFAGARAPDGRRYSGGGRGLRRGDEGSGFDLVRNAARAAIAAAEGLGPPTALTAALAEAFAVPVLRLGAAMQKLDTGTVASRLPLVLAVAAAGDAVALGVLGEGASALVRQAEAVAARAGLSLAGSTVALGGGVLRNATLLSARVAERLTRSRAQVRRIDDEFAAAAGAAALAEALHRRESPLCLWLEHDAP
jgi:N-acetylglucosamine kinase-like BadF-type ATPase